MMVTTIQITVKRSHILEKHKNIRWHTVCQNMDIKTLALLTAIILIDHSTYFAHTFNRCLESTFSAIIQWWMVPCGWVRTLGPGFCEWVRKVSLLSDARPQRLSVLTLTSECTACFSRGPHLGHSQLPQGTGLSTQQPSLRPHLLLPSMLPCYLWVRCWSPKW